MPKPTTHTVVHLLAFMSLIGCSPTVTPRNLDHPQRVSLIQLLANPDSLDNRKIAIAGFLVFEEENHSLYLSPEDANNGISNGGVELNFYHSPFSPIAPQRFNRKYVSVSGTFYAQGSSQWPVDIMAGIPRLVLTNITELRTPPFKYGPTGQAGKIDHLP